jgi:hypothetical protein
VTGRHRRNKISPTVAWIIRAAVVAFLVIAVLIVLVNAA